MNRVNARDAHRQFSRLLRDAEHGTSVVITRYGREIARLGPIEPAGGKRLPDLGEFRQSVQTRGTRLSKTVIQSRRQERY